MSLIFCESSAKIESALTSQIDASMASILPDSY